MTDIVERLHRDLMEISYDQIEEMTYEAAAEIERLRDHVDALLLVATAHESEIERLRAALQRIDGITGATDQGSAKGLESVI